MTMPHLGDFLGSLLGEMALARLRADTESLRIADVYSGHEILKHFPVPRFRLPEVHIDLPAIIEGDDSDSEKTGRLDVEKAVSVFAETLGERLAENQIRLPSDVSQTLQDRVHQVLGRLLQPDPQPSAQRLAEQLLILTGEAVEKDKALNEAFFGFRNAMRRDLIQRLTMARAGASRIRVILATSSIKEIPDTDRLVRLQLSIGEDSMEWVSIETEKGEAFRLVPE
jgi:hypothetical protein